MHWNLSCAAAIVALLRGTTVVSAGDVDVIVIGAGYAGLSAARDLVSAGLSVQIFEANDRAGGRTLNYDLEAAGLGPGYVELGGEWLAKPEEQPHAWRLIHEELGFDLIPSGFFGKADGRQGQVNATREAKLKAMIFSSQHPEGVRIPAGFETIVAVQGPSQMQQVARLEEEMMQIQAASASSKAYLDSMTFETWLRGRQLDADVHEMVRAVALTDLCQEPSQMSALFFLNVNAQAGKIAEDGQRFQVRGGLQAPALAMAAALGSRLHLGAQVTDIMQDGEGVSVTARFADRPPMSVRAKRVLFSGAPQTALAVVFEPPLPAMKRQVFQRMPMGNVMKMNLVYRKPFWRDQGLRGDIINLVNLDKEPPLCFDNSPIGSDLGMVSCFVAGFLANELVAMSADQRRDFLSSFVARSFGEEALKPLRYIDHDWAAEPFIGGGYSSVWPTGFTQYGQTLYEDFGKVSWIGSDLAPPKQFQTGYVDGAIMTGRDAAKRVVQELERSTAWQMAEKLGHSVTQLLYA